MQMKPFLSRGQVIFLGVLATLALAAIMFFAFATNKWVPANSTEPHHDHQGSPAHGKIPGNNGLSNDVSYLYNANGGTDSDGVVYDRWCNGSGAAMAVKNNGHWRIKAIDGRCFGEGDFFYNSTNYDAHKTASFQNGRGNWVWGPVSHH